MDFLRNARPTSKKYDFLHWLIKHAKQRTLKHGEFIQRSTHKLNCFYFLHEGNATYWHSKVKAPYYKAKAGSFIGFTDYIYKLCPQDLIKLVDGQSSFCEYEIKRYGKYKFTVRAESCQPEEEPCLIDEAQKKEKTEGHKVVLFEFNFRQKLMDQWQTNFPGMVDKFFHYQVNQLRVQLYHRLSLVSHFLQAEESLAPPMVDVAKQDKAIEAIRRLDSIVSNHGGALTDNS